MRLRPEEQRAVDEQLASTHPEPKPDPDKKGDLTIQQIRPKHRRTEDILIEMVDRLPSHWEPEDPRDPERPKKRKRRRRRRGPRVLTLYGPERDV